MASSVASLAPPRRFGGEFQKGPEERARFGTASGPVFIPPIAVAAPLHTDDVVDLMGWSRSRGLPLISRGAGTGMPGGNVGRGVSVDMARHWKTLAPVCPETRTVFAEAGVALARVEAAALAHGLFFPPLPSSAEQCTVGGVVANNSAGARSFGYGSVRDWVESVTVVLADGAVVTLGPPTLDQTRSHEELPPRMQALRDDLVPLAPAILQEWPRVRKNASGYGLDRFLPDGDGRALVVGSEGTLGLITGAVLRLAPIPAQRAVVSLALFDLDDLTVVSATALDCGAAACEFFGQRFLERIGASADALVPPGSAALVLLELEGDGDQIEVGIDTLSALARSLQAPVSIATEAGARDRLWAVRHSASPSIARAAREGLVSTQFIEDSVVPPERLPAYVRGVERILGDVGFDGIIFGHAGDGNAHVNPLVPARESDWRSRVRQVLEQTVDLVADLGGTLSGEHGDGRLRAPFVERVWSPAAFKGFNRVKSMLDPDSLLNPGVILPTADQDPLDGLGDGWSVAAGSRQ